MALPQSLQVGLKEWATVCAALESGRQILLLRKGGIFEAEGEFQIEDRQFLLFPTYLHQNPAMLKPEARKGDSHLFCEAPCGPTREKVAVTFSSAEPETIRISAAAEVTDIIRLTSRSQMDALDDQHIWTPPLIDMRFNYKPKNPLYLLLVRAWRLPASVELQNTPAYAGCKSWVPLESPISTAGATAAMDDAAYASRREKILRWMAGNSHHPM